MILILILIFQTKKWFWFEISVWVAILILILKSLFIVWFWFWSEINYRVIFPITDNNLLKGSFLVGGGGGKIMNFDDLMIYGTPSCILHTLHSVTLIEGSNCLTSWTHSMHGREIAQSLKFLCFCFNSQIETVYSNSI